MFDRILITPNFVIALIIQSHLSRKFVFLLFLFILPKQLPTGFDLSFVVNSTLTHLPFQPLPAYFEHKSN